MTVVRDARRRFSLQDRLAIAILRILELEGRPVSYADQQRLSAREIASWYDADHWPIRWIDGGPTHPSNGQLLLNSKGAAKLNQVNEHARKTAKRDIPELAKTKRLRKSREDIEENRRRLLAKAGRSDYGPNDNDRASQGSRGGGRGKARIASRRFAKVPDGMRYDWKARRYRRHEREE